MRSFPRGIRAPGVLRKLHAPLMATAIHAEPTRPPGVAPTAFAIPRFRAYQGSMPEQRILELEQQLVTAHEAVAKLTLTNTDLTDRLSDAEVRNKKLRRSSRKDERALKDQLVLALSRRG